MGLTMSQWDDLTEYDRAWPLALALADARDEAERCRSCGGRASECQDADNQHAFEVEFRRCFRTRAVVEAQRKRTDMDGVLTVATLNPAKKKSARPRDGRGRFTKKG